MSETISLHHVLPKVLAPEVIMAPLLDRAPLADRQKPLGKARQKKEASYRPLHKGADEFSPVTWKLAIAVYSARLALFFSGLRKRGHQNALNHQLVHRDLFVNDLPADLEGFRILHLSDFHLPRRHPELAEAIGRLLAGVEVDLCALTGDYRFGYFGPEDHIVPQLRTLLSGVVSRYGVVCVLGNHDCFSVGGRLEAGGFPVLYNEGMALPVGEACLWICGIDEDHKFDCGRLDQAVHGAPEGACRLLLAHTPETIPEAAAHGIAAYLTGHTHGGQVRLPWLGALIYNAKCTDDQVWGVWQYENMTGHTTAGIGSTDILVRFNCPPEAVVLTLRRKP